MRKLDVLIAGSTGYIGVQLVKLLQNHPNINIKYLCGNSSVGKNISFFDSELKNKRLPRIVKLNKSYFNDVDVIFTALPNGEAQILSNQLLKKNILIDLAADFRLEDPNEYKRWYKSKHKAIKNISKSIYALPELCKNYLKKYKIIACPGCYPTSILLPLLPLFKKNLIFHKNIIIDSKSGYSGAGREIHKKTTKKKLHESLSAYGVGFHRHNSEIDQELSTIYIDLKDNIKPITIQNVLKKFYRKKPFVKISKFNIPIGTNSVINTNKCLISVCKTKYKNKIIILSAIDNLIKGGAGQAVQNMNIFFNFLETKGLK